MNELDPKAAALLVDHYRRAEDLSDMGLSRRMELGWGLFELMNHIGETRLRRALYVNCPEISWEGATKAMHLVLVAGPGRLPALSWPLDSPIFAWLTDCYRQAELLCYSSLLRRVKLGDRLLDLRLDAGELRLRRMLIEFCPEIPWVDAQSAMNWAVVVDREFLETSCPPPFRGR